MYSESRCGSKENYYNSLQELLQGYKEYKSCYISETFLEDFLIGIRKYSNEVSVEFRGMSIYFVKEIK